MKCTQNLEIDFACVGKNKNNQDYGKLPKLLWKIFEVLNLMYSVSVIFVIDVGYNFCLGIHQIDDSLVCF